MIPGMPSSAMIPAQSVASGPTGQIVFESSATWVVPAGVTSISIVAVSAGEDGSGTGDLVGGRGGRLAYANNASVTPGETLNITVVPTQSAVSNAGGYLVRANRTGGSVGDVVNTGGSGVAPPGGVGDSMGGGGAAGYSGNGGDGHDVRGATVVSSGAGAGGGGSGGVGLGGGGVGLLGEGASGASVTNAPGDKYKPGLGGSGGDSGSGDLLSGDGGKYGGGGGAQGAVNPDGVTEHYGAGGPGGLRIIWPGDERQFPSTRTADE